MQWFEDIIKQVEPVQYVYGIVAIFGGIARYLNSFTKGDSPFDLRILLASMFMSGFSGWMFAIVGMSLDMPQSITFIMAGTGGFFGDQTMKLVLEYVQTKVK